MMGLWVDTANVAEHVAVFFWGDQIVDQEFNSFVFCWCITLYTQALDILDTIYILFHMFVFWNFHCCIKGRLQDFGPYNLYSFKKKGLNDVDMLKHQPPLLVFFKGHPCKIDRMSRKKAGISKRNPVLVAFESIENRIHEWCIYNIFIYTFAIKINQR